MEFKHCHIIEFKRGKISTESYILKWDENLLFFDVPLFPTWPKKIIIEVIWLIKFVYMIVCVAAVWDHTHMSSLFVTPTHPQLKNVSLVM